MNRRVTHDYHTIMMQSRLMMKATTSILVLYNRSMTRNST
jgi:hypothetical protein